MATRVRKLMEIEMTMLAKGTAVGVVLIVECCGLPAETLRERTGAKRVDRLSPSVGISMVDAAHSYLLLRRRCKIQCVLTQETKQAFEEPNFQIV